MPPGDDDYTLAELARGIDRIEESLTRLIATLGREYVSLILWSQRNEQVDDRFSAQGREIGDLRSELRTVRNQAEARRPTWPAVVSAVVAVVSAGITGVLLITA